MNSPYCKHGFYVGGCGADYMCSYCESGTNPGRYRAVLIRQKADGYECVMPGHWHCTPEAAIALIELSLIDTLAAQGSYIAIETR